MLNKKIYDLEQDSRYLLIALERPNPKKDEIVEAVSDARESLIALKSELEQIGFEVRKLTGVNEPNIELRTMNAIGIREAALDEIDILVEGDRIFQGDKKRKLIEQIKFAVKELNAASIALFKVVEKL